VRPIPKITYKTPEELAELIREREAEAAMLPPGMTRQSVLIEVARLRSYAELKRAFVGPQSAGGSGTRQKVPDAGTARSLGKPQG
jgi:hypothetical protein